MEAAPGVVMPMVVPSRANEREVVSEQIVALAREVAEHDAAVGTVLDRLADAVRRGRPEDTKGYAGAVDARAIADLLLGRRHAIWGALEVARNVLVFAPIAVTWYGLSTATDAYAKLLDARPELVTKPFLLLWQAGLPGTMHFSTLALIDALLIGILIVLSLVLHVRSDLKDAATRTRVLLRESEIRALVAHALSAAAPSTLGDAEADALVDEMVAEERRIYERAMEREQRLFDMESAIAQLSEAATKLARAADAIGARGAVADAAQTAPRDGTAAMPEASPAVAQTPPLRVVDDELPRELARDVAVAFRALPRTPRPPIG
jgi:hypothetical protein